ncbi:helix-turn-helix domain-containing protein [Streptomyces sp. NPDC049837]|uniref:helix-turn-helix domain-containing protein n=1 Tax=Streptomyces sp. NPDC049837 TaxID=3155277 RepID=UPI0034181EA8
MVTTGWCVDHLEAAGVGVESDDTGADDLTLAVVRLLAEEAPLHRFDELLHQSHQYGPSARDHDRLAQAVGMARGIRESAVHARRREAGTVALIDSATEFMAATDLDQLSRSIAVQARRLLGLDLAYITAPAGDAGWCVHTSVGETTAMNVGLAVPVGHGLGALVHDSTAPFWTPDYLGDQRIQHSEHVDEVVRAEGLQAIIAVPLGPGDDRFGALYGAERKIRHFHPDEVGLFRSLAELAGVAIEGVRRLERARNETEELRREQVSLRSRLSRSAAWEKVMTRLTGAALNGEDPQALAEAAGTILGGTVSVRDDVGRWLVAPDEASDRDEPSLAQASIDAHATGEPVALGNGRWAAAISAGGENLGLLVLSDPDRRSAVDQGLLTAAAQAVGISLVLQRDTTAAEGAVRSELLDALLTTPANAARPLQARAGRLGLEPAGEYVVVVARPEGDLGRAAVWASSYAYRMAGLNTVHDGCIVLLLPGADASAMARTVSGELSPLVPRPVSVGAAGPAAGISAAAELYDEALRCLEAITALRGPGGAAATEDLGFVGLLLADSTNVEGFVSSTIGPVLAYDSERGTELTATLAAYFEAGGSPSRAASALHLHANSVFRRLGRVTELLGPDWQQPRRALEIQLALQLQQTKQMLIRRQGTGRQE